MMPSWNHLVLGLYLVPDSCFAALCLVYLHTETIYVFICSSNFSERQKKWKEELVKELESKRGKFFYFLRQLKNAVCLFLPCRYDYVGTAVFSI